MQQEKCDQLLSTYGTMVFTFFQIVLPYELKMTYWVQEDFFGELHRMLMEMPEVTDMHPVPDAHVPVMKFKFLGVSIDLLYAKLSLWVIPEVSADLFCQLLIFICFLLLFIFYFYLKI